MLRRGFIIALLSATIVSVLVSLLLPPVPTGRRRPQFDSMPADEARALALELPGLIRVPLTGTDDPAFLLDGSAGEILWDENDQQGVLVHRGLKPTSATFAPDMSYQLWIYDGERASPHPVDGGLFSVSPHKRRTDEIPVAFEPSLRVGRATRFEITVEGPHGAVVSDRTRIVAAGDVPPQQGTVTEEPERE